MTYLTKIHWKCAIVVCRKWREYSRGIMKEWLWKKTIGKVSNRNSIKCPLDGSFMVKNVVYKASVKFEKKNKHRNCYALLLLREHWKINWRNIKLHPTCSLCVGYERKRKQKSYYKMGGDENDPQLSIGNQDVLFIPGGKVCDRNIPKFE